ncbi:MAG TPA: hypothetical protein VD971_11750 [Phycisphaerales bacterium]|nr:hypothetical protein [Phycisphaerales bacterium]
MRGFTIGRRVLPLVLMAAAGSAVGAVGEQAALRAAYPGVRTHEWNGRTMAFYGTPMSAAATPRDAARAWIVAYGDAFGVGALEVEEERETTLSRGDKTVLVYNQKLGGVPVEFGRLKLVTHNDGAGSRVVLASGKLAKTPDGGFAAVAVTPRQAVDRVAGSPVFGDIAGFTEPELVVYQGEGDFADWITPVRAWRFSGANPDIASQRAYTFFVDAATGDLVHARSEVYHIDITGSVHGMASPNNTADHAGNPPVMTPVPDIRVTVQGTGTSVFTDAAGNFTIPWGGTTPVTLDVTFNDGEWSRVADASGVMAPLALSVAATPGTPVMAHFNTSPSEITTAQTNAFIYQTQTHNFFKDRAPAFTALDTQVPANVMVAGSCNAFYTNNAAGTNPSTNYFPISATCNNTSFASVINHEYGHHIVNRLGLAQGGFGEGFGDTMSILINDDPVIGRFFRLDGSPVRRPDLANQQYPCSAGAVHTCGQILGGAVWDLRNNFVATYGTPGLDVLRQLHIDWAVTTDGGEGTLNSAHPLTLIEYLTADDDNAYICDGTPHIDEINAAFNAHGIAPIPYDLRAVVSITEPPAVVAVGDPIPVQVGAADGTAMVIGVDVHYRHDPANAFYAAELAPSGGGQYTGVVPGFNCGQSVELYFTVRTSAGVVNVSKVPCAGPERFTVSAPRVPVSSQDFESGPAGWTTGPDTAAVVSRWVLDNPRGTNAQPADDVSDPGVNCWFTGQGSVGGGDGEADVDGGYTLLTSPVLDLTGLIDPRVSYKRWYSNGQGATPFTDVFTVEVSNNNGASWVNGEVVGPAQSADTSPGWRDGGFTLSSAGLTPTSAVVVRFRAEDQGPGSLVEAAIDEFKVDQLHCPAPCHDVDYNNDGLFPDNQDLQDYLAVFGGGACSTGNCDSVDFNGDGLFPDNDDITAFFSVFGGGGC